ncbi:hypothetical protein A2765_01190 [Candidatus Kaiserbacteria bacterium RIFCSPHIGHO2_01_FULL_56_24]|uniref:Toxin-antitoxin system protein n=1 Tax=Candidatus Kaiserbacteria bacterium RIFCSPHIGHO2_01_FULL_56_24 TaxID=1798487 RepID=A0A1F6DCN2_9BACT|nr:MAG: hypothetical protein A2765_01190 [Candidatus Kaiserbacteria bacterium RIFCSPHIGHO2_01_FULL_56_24]
MEKDFDRWTSSKKRLHAGRFSDYVHAREVWWCALGVNIGVEADGKHGNFERPVLVLRKFSQDAVLAVALTTRIKKNPYYVTFRHDRHEFAAVISQIRLISTKRLLRFVYKMDSTIFRKISLEVQGMVASNNRPPHSSRGPRRPHGH